MNVNLTAKVSKTTLKYVEMTLKCNCGMALIRLSSGREGGAFYLTQLKLKCQLTISFKHGELH